MKKLIYGLYALFLILIVMTFYMANKSYDGLVEDRYYEKSKAYFEIRKKEEEMGIKITFNHILKVGSNDMSIVIRKGVGPLSGAVVTIFVANISSIKFDRTFPLKEVSPGIYRSKVDIPFSGRWLLRAEIEHIEIRTERTWDLRTE